MSPSPLESAAAEALATQVEVVAAGALVDAYRARLGAVLEDAPDPARLVADLMVTEVDTTDQIVVFTDGSVCLAVTRAAVALVAKGEDGQWESSAEITSAATLGAALAGQPMPPTRMEA